MTLIQKAREFRESQQPCRLRRYSLGKFAHR